jgi:hypothetical protein
MSSLQQALNNASNRLKLKKLDDGNTQNGGGGSGAFESSFAQGLDISEFLSTATKPTTIGGEDDANERAGSFRQSTSAAEELLKIKEGERRKRQIQDEEEVKMHKALQKRLNSLKQNAIDSEKERKRSAFEIGDALLRMHGTDEMAAEKLTQKSSTRNGGASSRRRSLASKRTNHKGNRVSLAKKRRQTKF